ncbi:MAG: ABC transporter permease [Candidatus Saccharibacteria bacterium]|nr:ABC transporter permease [Candidatus Saccharibacteria bacterium]
MKITSLLKQSFKSVWSNKVRSSLTILGIVIGIAAVISLVGLGKGLQSSVTGRISSLGTTNVTIRSQDPNRATSQRGLGGGPPGGGGGMQGGFSFGGSSTATITTAEYDYIKSLKGIASASPNESTQVAVTKSSTSDTASQYQVYGVDTDYLKLEDLEVSAGANITNTQVSSSEKVVLIGSKAAEELFGAESPVGQSIYISDTEYKIVGVFKSKDTEQRAQSGFPGGTSQATSSFVTGYKTWLSIAGTEKLSSITAKADSERVVDTVANTIEQKLYTDHGVTKDKADIAVSTSKDLLNTVSSVTSGFTATLAGIAAISLVVGGIGIMNIMLVTVTERTREIGLRRALGAKRRHIVYQFLIESVLLTLIGGLIGVAIGVIFGSYATSLLSSGFGGAAGGSEIKVTIDTTTILIAVAVSSAIGVVFGLFPALKASRLDPVEALRYE